MNFFAVLLCLAMNRTYQHYYFVPVISFWYLVHYVTHFIPPRVRWHSDEKSVMHFINIMIFRSMQAVLRINPCNTSTSYSNLLDLFQLFPYFTYQRYFLFSPGSKPKAKFFVFLKVFFEKVFVTRPWKALFVTEDDDIKTWWFRWKIDRYRWTKIFSLLQRNHNFFSLLKLRVRNVVWIFVHFSLKAQAF